MLSFKRVDTASLIVKEGDAVEFLTSTWFAWVVGIIIFGSIFTIFWESFIEESGIEWPDIVDIAKKLVILILAITIGPFLILIEKKAWGAIIALLFVIGMFVLTYIMDPGGGAAPWD
jgi:phosphatidylglycerophosphate synthase